MPKGRTAGRNVGTHEHSVAVLRHQRRQTPAPQAALLQASPLRTCSETFAAGFVSGHGGLMVEPVLAHSPADARTACIAEEDLSDQVPGAAPCPVCAAYDVTALRLRDAPHRTICMMRDFMPDTVAGCMSGQCRTANPPAPGRSRAGGRVFVGRLDRTGIDQREP